MAQPGKPHTKFLALGRVLQGLHGWAWALGVVFSGVSLTALTALLREWWNDLPLVGQAGAVLAVFAASFLVAGLVSSYVRQWLRDRQGRLEDRLDVRLLQPPIMGAETRLQGNAEFWKISLLVELTHRPADPTRVATLDFVLTVSLFSPVRGMSSFDLQETRLGGLFEEDPPLYHLLRAPLRFQGPHTEPPGFLVFVLDPGILASVGGRENIDQNNCTLRITDHISRQSMSVVASQLDWSAFGGPPRRSPEAKGGVQ